MELLPWPSHSSWLSPKVKDEMRNLVIDAVQIALDDDEDVLDQLVGKFVTKSNRLDEDEFGLGGEDPSAPSFSYPKPLRDAAYDEQEDDGKCPGLGGSATAVLTEVLGAQKLHEEPCNVVLKRAEGIAFAWSSVYDKERRRRKYRLYAQGRPPFEIVEAPSGGVDNEVDDPNKLSLSAPNSTAGRLMDRIANGLPLNRAFLVDELKIPVDITEEQRKDTIPGLLYVLVDEGLLYGTYCN